MRILVTGATGTVGRHVVRELIDAGADVRALTRDPRRAGLPARAEAVTGDLTRPGDLRDALKGVERLYLFPEPDTAREVMALAGEAGVRRVVVLSSGAVTAGYDTSYHLPVERAAEESGLEWTHVRPGEFAMNHVALWGPPIRTERVVRHPYPDLESRPVHERDIADMAVTALLADGHTGRAYAVDGPAPLTLREQVRAIAAALGEEIRFDEVTPEEAREHYLRQGGFAAENADMLLGFTDYEGNPVDPEQDEGPGADPGPTADRDTGQHADPGTDPGTGTDTDTAGSSAPCFPAATATGRPARPFAAWARDHADDFR
ncbi:SDR family oxidoreductase [Streptomyces uncialis]|uniref:SDR family oxidoreductase n=1 Tax=Streptomyces uncialis TaxID=1048205 RepID=UPI00379EBF1A